MTRNVTHWSDPLHPTQNLPTVTSWEKKSQTREEDTSWSGKQTASNHQEPFSESVKDFWVQKASWKTASLADNTFHHRHRTMKSGTAWVQQRRQSHKSEIPPAFQTLPCLGLPLPLLDAGPVRNNLHIFSPVSFWTLSGYKIQWIKWTTLG